MTFKSPDILIDEFLLKFRFKKRERELRSQGIMLIWYYLPFGYTESRWKKTKKELWRMLAMNTNMGTNQKYKFIFANKG